MTSAELISRVKFLIDKLDSLNYPNFQDVEILALLNKAQNRFIKQRYGPVNNKRLGFEESQKRIEDLKTLVKDVNLTPQANNSSNIDSTAVFVELPLDHWFLVQDRILISYLDCHNTVQTKHVKAVPTQHDDFDTVMSDPFNKPNENKVLRLFAESKIELVTGSADITVSSYKLRYIRKPLDITATQTSELPEYAHEELCDLCVQLALEGIESPRQGTFDNILNTNE